MVADISQEIILLTEGISSNFNLTYVTLFKTYVSDFYFSLSGCPMKKSDDKVKVNAEKNQGNFNEI